MTSQPIPRQTTREPVARNGLLRLLAVNCLGGAVLGILTLAALIATDVAQLWTLLSNASDPWTPLFMLSLVFAATFGGAAGGTAAFLQDDSSGDDDDGSKRRLGDTTCAARRPITVMESTSPLPKTIR